MYVDIVISNAFNLNSHFFFLRVKAVHAGYGGACGLRRCMRVKAVHAS